MLAALQGWINSVLQWLLDAGLYIPRKLYSLLIDGLIYAFQHLPVPGFISNASSYSSALGGTDVAYFLGLFQVPYGCAAILSAYVLRFLIRRIPIIG